jgi:hypothetical protein
MILTATPFYMMFFIAPLETIKNLRLTRRQPVAPCINLQNRVNYKSHLSPIVDYFRF